MGLIAVGCGDDDAGTDGGTDGGVDAAVSTDAGSPCDDFACGDHGECAIAASGPVCVCDEGFGGERCEQCYAGYHDDGTGNCVLDERCMPASCSFAGECADEGGSVSCTCEDGHDGDHCESCADGHHRDASGACVVDEDCEMSNPCGENGTCEDASGTIVCECAPGYAGEACDVCYPGYHADESGACVLDQTCLPTTCSGAGTCSLEAGRVTCACEAAYTGASCESCATGYHRDAGGACVVDEDCEATDPCDRGTCDDAGGVIRCICAMGYAGELCDECADGYREDDSGACVLVQECDPTACNGRGACDDTGGVVTCACDAGYTGPRCASCATGFHRDATDACVADERCADRDPCGAFGTCVDATGEIECVCDVGYAGELCDACYPGYVRNASGVCIIPLCRADMCTPGTCDDRTGSIVCDCDLGHAQCGEDCVADALDQQSITPSSCGTAAFCYGQSFTAGRSGRLSRIRHAGVSTGTHTLTIYAGGTTGCTPGGAVLHTQTVTNSSAPGDKDIEISPPLSVVAGQVYTFKLENGNGWNHPCLTTNPYPRGRFLAADSWDIGFSTFVASCP